MAASEMVQDLIDKLNGHEEEDESKSVLVPIEQSLDKGKILITSTYHNIIDPSIDTLRNAGFGVTLLPNIRDANKSKCQQQFIEHITREQNEYAAILMHGAFNFPIPNNIFGKMRNLKLISLTSSGFDHIDAAYCRKNGIKVTNIAASQGDSVADLTVGLMIATCHNLFSYDKFDSRKEFCFASHDLNGSTVGIVGFGHVGKAISVRLSKGFHCKVYYANKSGKVGNNFRDYGANYMSSLDELLTVSDFVIAACPLNEETENMFDEQSFLRMKNSAFFINVGRGKLCKTEALITALQKNWIAGAGLDVTDPEPLPNNHALRQFRNVVVLPHIGSATVECKIANLDMAVDNIRRVLGNQSCQNVVN